MTGIDVIVLMKALLPNQSTSFEEPLVSYINDTQLMLHLSKVYYMRWVPSIATNDELYL